MPRASTGKAGWQFANWTCLSVGGIIPWNSNSNFGPFKDKKTMENCNLRKYCCTFMVKMMMPGAASLNLQPINLQFVQKLAILQLYKIFLFHRWYDGGVKSIFAHCYIFLFLYIILLLLFWTFVMDGFFWWTVRWQERRWVVTGAVKFGCFGGIR